MGRTTVLALVIVVVFGVEHRATQDDLEMGGEWLFAAGEPAETLLINADRMPAASTRVTLPHRVLEPNRSLWYARNVELPRSSALFVDADDGAQVFLDGARLENQRRWFVVPDSPATTRRLVIRVFNNAMAGGLRRVRIAGVDRVPQSKLTAPLLPPGFAPVESEGFRTRMPPPGTDCRFTAWADSQGGWQTFGALITLMRRRDAHFSVGVGDLVNDGSDPESWRSFVTVLSPLASTMPVIPIAGNHDYDGFYNDLRARHYQDVFRPDGTSWFAWSCGSIRLAAIDLNREFPIGITNGSPQHRWLMNEVASNAWRSARWRILLVHQPPWSRSWEGYDGDDAVRAIVGRIAEAAGLDLVISGHSHAYEHLIRRAGGREVAILITGGGGGGLEAPLTKAPADDGEIFLRHHFAAVSASADGLSVEAVDINGDVFDRWSLRK